MHIEIRELEQVKGKDGQPATFRVNICFDRGPDYQATVSDPFDEEQERRLEWYYEDWLNHPFMNIVPADQAARSTTDYGQVLFEQLFKSDVDVYADYKDWLKQQDDLIVEIAGSPAFHALHWEALQDPNHPRPLAVEATFLRKNLKPANVHAKPRPSPTLNILLVCTRPFENDVGYRTISRPLVEALANSAIQAKIDLVRPGSFEALVGHLEQSKLDHGPGYYHIIHFDLHGSLLDHDQYRAIRRELLNMDLSAAGLSYEAGFGRTEIPYFEGQKAFLFFDGPGPDAAEPVADDTIAELMQAHQVPVAILNACQSAKQVSGRVEAAGQELPEETEPDEADEPAASPPAASETSLGSRLMAAGVQLVVAMGYSVTVTAAEILMTSLYRELLAGRPPAQAIRLGRLALYNNRERRAAYDYTIELEDWLLPVVYQNRPVTVETKSFAGPEEESAYLERQASRYKAPPLEYGFVGRDLDILNIERRLLGSGGRSQAFRKSLASGSNVLLIRGLGGAGKSSLLRHLMEWWQRTGLVGEVTYFGYDERVWSLEQILDGLGRTLYGEQGYIRQLQLLSAAARQQKLVQKLRAERHLLVLDNMEAITGAALAIRHTLDEAERERLAAFVQTVHGGRSLVLLGSRGGEEWLVGPVGDGSPGKLVYELPGLDRQAAADLAERILQRAGATQVRSDPEQRDDFQRLMRLLDGHPLAMEVILANLKQKRPAEILTDLTAGAEDVDPAEIIFRSVDYSHSNLDPEAQELLLCLVPFVGVVDSKSRRFGRYIDQLLAQPELSGLAHQRWPEVFRALKDWGLATDHEMGDGFLRLQPVLPYFLRRKLGDGKMQDAVETAFRQHYDDIGAALGQYIESKEPQERQTGQALIGLEYENLHKALQLALVARTRFYNLLIPLFLFLRDRQDHRRAIDLLRPVLAAREEYPKTLAGEIGSDFVAAGDWLAHSLLMTQQYEAAARVYQDSLKLLDELTGVSDEWRGKSKASTYHQLGRVAQAQRQWAAAEGYYQQALALFVEFNDRYEQAGTYHQLGRVAEEQRQWPAAEGYYQQALALFVEFNDRYSQASTYHQLGMVAQAQRQWEAAEGYYQQALALKVEFNDRYSQASTYHQLGMVAQAQRQWAAAEGYYQQALALKVEFNDRYSQASTYGQLGLMAEAQEKWSDAAAYLLQALEIFHEFKDEHSQGIALGGLARVWQAGGDESVVARVAEVLGEDAGKVEVLFREMLAA